MKVSYTPKEYARLLELVHLGLWVAGTVPEDPATLPERYAPIAEKTFALAEVMGCADLVEMDVNGKYYAGEKLLQGPSQAKIEQFVEDSFWGELVSRLAERDLRSDLNSTKPREEFTADEKHQLVEFEDAYWREFEESGVNHLVVLRGGKG